MSVVSRRDVNSRGRWRTLERGISTSLLRESLHENKVNHLKIKQKIIRTSMPTKTGEITTTATTSQFNHSFCWFSILGLEIHLIHLHFSTKKTNTHFFNRHVLLERIEKIIRVTDHLFGNQLKSAECRRRTLRLNPCC